MFELTTDIEVRCTQAQAFDHVARGFFDHHGLWDSTVTSMEKTSEGPIRVGTTGLEGRRFGRMRMESVIHVTAFDPDRYFRYEAANASMRQEAEITIEERPGGAGLRIHVRLTPVSLPSRLFWPLMRPSVERNIREHAERMRLALDAESLQPK